MVPRQLIFWAAGLVASSHAYAFSVATAGPRNFGSSCPVRAEPSPGVHSLFCRRHLKPNAKARSRVRAGHVCALAALGAGAGPGPSQADTLKPSESLPPEQSQPLPATFSPSPGVGGPQTYKYGIHATVFGKVVNVPGLLYMLSVFGWAVVLYPALLTSWLWSLVFDQGRCRAVDWTVFVWAKICMLTLTFRPRVSGLDNLPPRGEAVMYLPNHCSFMDILTLSGFLPRTFKYISKIEILRIPLIGWAMRMAGHVAIRRADRRSQLQTFKDAVATLKRGNSVVTFAEGTRSKDGRLQKFKKGPFTMAKRGGVRIVPVTLTNLHTLMPGNALMPLGFARDVEIKVHPAIDTKDKSEEELMELTRTAIVAGLPEWQRPGQLL